MSWSKENAPRCKCGKRVSKKDSQCWGCYIESRQPTEEQVKKKKERQKKYKAGWYQRNKKRIEKTKKRATPEEAKFYNAKYNYGIGKEEYILLLEQQDSKCKICRHENRMEKGARLQIDHNHKTGNVRGLLCGKCNRGLGQFNDDVELLKLAVQYLEEEQND